MRPQFQTPGDNQCLRHCIATIFDLPVSDVPFFGGTYAFDDEARANGTYGMTQMRDLRAWLQARGLDLITHYADEEGHPTGLLPWGICTASGPTVRGTRHAVVWDAGFWDSHRQGDDRTTYPYGRMVHDPHHSGAGLLKVEDWTCFVLRDPAKLAWRPA